MPPSIEHLLSQIFTKMPPTYATKYDPVPPYDYSDASPRPAPSVTSTQASTSIEDQSDTATITNFTTIDDEEEDDEIGLEELESGREGRRRHKCRRNKSGTLTERERCRFALGFVAMSLLAVVGCVWLIALYAYLGARNKTRAGHE